ncbi:TAP-like protein [Lentzea xinjiangensis]|uniref:TAP-like protein n=1 Tax=Lentzea xinjiangensis TaxID=402600 RepID=A0A1H9UGW2_9PSEU|nr:alpha/beta fold hydrolase [Lentzea xinjiangensis]SES08676.1 TAP-like protein [Lentzea xinjiangensis]
MRSTTAGILGATVTLFAIGAVTPAGAGVPPVAHECATATQRCDGRVEVPLDWTDPGSARISVSFAWLPRRDRSRPAEGTVLAIPGGPTAALPMTELYRQALGSVLDRQNMLIVDPRGLGESTPLLCPTGDLGRPDSIAECARHVGSRARYFTSDQAVADFDAVRQALGVRVVSVYGSSYGTVWGHAYATRFPDRTRAVLLDGVMRVGADGYVRSPLGRPVHPDLGNLDVVCRPSRSCRALPGVPQQTWADLVTHLRKHPDPAVPLLSLLRLPQQAVEPAVGRELTAAAAAYLAGDPAPLRRLARTFTGGAVTGQPQTAPDPTVAGYLAYVCGDAVYPYDRTATPEERRQQLDAVYAEQKPFAPFSTDEVLNATHGNETQWCLNWPTPRQSPPVPAQPRYPAVPMLAIGGELDVATPATNAVDIARRFPLGRSLVNRFGGHTPTLGAVAGFTGPYWDCATETMRSFLRAPDRFRQRNGCTAENYRAVGSFPVTSESLPRVPVGGLAGPERALVTAAVATAVDALARRNPNGAATSRLTEEPGLRGGTLQFPGPGTVTLDGVRFVADAAVSGRLTVTTSHRARAELVVADPSGRRRAIGLEWAPFRTADVTAVTGTLDGSRPFHLRYPT